MVGRYLIDTNVIIDYLAGSMPVEGLSLMDTIIDSDGLIVSVVTQIEVLGFQAPADYLQKCRDLLSLAEIVPLADANLIERTIQVRQQAKIKLPDAVIAATALTMDLTIISRNGKDFSRVQGLNHIDPHSL